MQWNFMLLTINIRTERKVYRYHQVNAIENLKHPYTWPTSQSITKKHIYFYFFKKSIEVHNMCTFYKILHLSLQYKIRGSRTNQLLSPLYMFFFICILYRKRLWVRDRICLYYTHIHLLFLLGYCNHIGRWIERFVILFQDNMGQTEAVIHKSCYLKSYFMQYS